MDPVQRADHRRASADPGRSRSQRPVVGAFCAARPSGAESRHGKAALFCGGTADRTGGAGADSLYNLIGDTCDPAKKRNKRSLHNSYNAGSLRPCGLRGLLCAVGCVLWRRFFYPKRSESGRDLRGGTGGGDGVFCAACQRVRGAGSQGRGRRLRHGSGPLSPVWRGRRSRPRAYTFPGS